MEVKKINENPQVVLTLSWEEALDLVTLADRTSVGAVTRFFVKCNVKNPDQEQIDRIDALLNDISGAFDEEGVE